MRFINKCKSVVGLKVFEAGIPIDREREVKSNGVVMRDGIIVDYKGVTFSGYASTFNTEDRDNEVMMAGAFTKALTQFKTNPIALKDHRNAIDSVVGGYTQVTEDEKGLFVSGTISDAPDCINVRFKMMEKHIRALSVAGLMRFAKDGKSITEVRLWEISLVAIPANQEALVEATVKIRDMDAEDGKQFNLETADAVQRPVGIKGRTKPDKRYRIPGIRLGWAGLVVT